VSSLLSTVKGTNISLYLQLSMSYCQLGRSQPRQSHSPILGGPWPACSRPERNDIDEAFCLYSKLADGHLSREKLEAKRGSRSEITFFFLGRP